jgi:hypothetical protein
MKIKHTELMAAVKDNFDIWKVVLPILLGGFIAGLAIVEFALIDPAVFLGWTLTCFIAGALAYRSWARRTTDTAGEWS